MFHQSKGTLKYENTTSGYRAVVEIDQGIADYYRSLIPKYMTANKQSWPSHITVVRTGVEYPLHMNHWRAYHNEVVDFIYSSVIHMDGHYYWLNCFSRRIDEIRSELGLTIKSRVTIPPDGYSKCYHITLANRKQ
jgi:hypothetical protein